MKQAQSKPFIVGPYIPGIDVMIHSCSGSFIDHHRAMLLSIGFAPITTTNLETALAILHVMAIELVIVDGETAIQETQKILEYAMSDGRKVPVLVVGQDAGDEPRRRALALGAADYLDHPALQDDVVQAILPDRPRRSKASLRPQET